MEILENSGWGFPSFGNVQPPLPVTPSDYLAQESLTLSYARERQCTPTPAECWGPFLILRPTALVPGWPLARLCTQLGLCAPSRCLHPDADPLQGCAHAHVTPCPTLRWPYLGTSWAMFVQIRAPQSPPWM